MDESNINNKKDDEKRAKIREAYHKQYHKDVEKSRQKQNDYLRERRKDPEYIKKRREYKKAYHEKLKDDPEYKAKRERLLKNRAIRNRPNSRLNTSFGGYDKEKLVNMDEETILEFYPQAISDEELRLIKLIMPLASKDILSKRQKEELQRYLRGLTLEQTKRICREMEDYAKVLLDPNEGVENPTNVLTFAVVWKNGFIVKKDIQLNAVTGEWRFVN